MLSANDVTGGDMPAWKKELILRRRTKCGNQLVSGAQQSLSVQQATVQPNTCTSSAIAGNAVTLRCNKNESSSSSPTKMVQERPWIGQMQIIEKNDDSDSSEELRYGPGIVSKLKNRYLSLTLREATTRNRPTILNLRKATSLEHILDDEDEDEEEEDHSKRYSENIYQKLPNGKETSKNIPNRYRNTSRKPDMKRARSVEVISSTEITTDVKPKRESLHEDMLNRKEIDKKTFEINDIKTFSNNIGRRLNRPKRITPVMNEREKPPADVVKQTMKLFEKPGSRTKQPQCTGEVAAKVACFKEIIETKKPPVKIKPCTAQPNNATKVTTKPKQPVNRKSFEPKPKKTSPVMNTPNIPTLRSPVKNNPSIIAPQQPQSPIPDVSQVEIEKPESEQNGNSSLTETPDLIVHSSLKSTASEVEDFLSHEITQSNGTNHRINEEETSDHDGPKTIPNNQKLGNSVVFNFSEKPKTPNYLPLQTQTQNTTPKTNLKRSSPITSPKTPPRIKQKNFKVPITEPLKVEIIAAERKVKPMPPVLKTSPIKEVTKKPIDSPPKEVVVTNGEKISDMVKEKNAKNVSKSVKIVAEPVKSEVVVIAVPKVKKTANRKQDQNCLVFDFTARKDVPDYVGNDGRIKTGKIEKPKPGEGGITLLPGATLDESLIDDDEDWVKSLEGPPSPLCVTFINDNILIDGRSSIKQKLRKPKMSIKFVETDPDIFEYPSESSLLLDEGHTRPLSPSPTSVGHSVPNLSGSTLANYTPKSSIQLEEFQLGMKPTALSSNGKEVKINGVEEMEGNMEDEHQPVLFSSGTNSDILF